MSRTTGSLSNSTTCSGTMDEGKLDNSNNTKYDSYPGRKSNVARLHVESQNEGVVSALETLQSKLRQLQEHVDNNARKKGSHLFDKQNSTISDPELSWSQELADVESKCHSLQNNLLDILKIIHFEEKSNPLFKDIDLKDETETEPYAITAMALASATSHPFSIHHKLKQNKPVGNTAKPCPAYVGDYSTFTRDRLSKHPHHRLTAKQLPFVLSGMTGKSFSLPVNIQLLLESLKMHNPWMCSLASDCAAIQKLILKVENDLKDAIIALRDSVGYLTLESCTIRKRILQPQEMQNQQIQQITNYRDTLIANMHQMDTLAKQLHNFKAHLNFSRTVPSAAGLTAERETVDVKTHAAKRKKMSVNTTKRNTQTTATLGQKIRGNSRPKWNDKVTLDVIRPRRPSVGNIKYRELLQMALKRNGFQLRERKS